MKYKTYPKIEINNEAKMTSLKTIIKVINTYQDWYR